MRWKFTPPSPVVSLFQFGRGHREDVAAGWLSSRTQAMGGASPFLLSSKCTFRLQFPEWGLFSKIQPWEWKVLLRPPGLIMWLNPVKSSMHTFKNLKGKYGNLLVFCHSKHVVCVSFLIKSAIYWSRVICLFSFSLPCIYRHQLINQQILSELLKKSAQHITQSFEMTL